jgi:hypothetical protein
MRFSPAAERLIGAVLAGRAASPGGGRARSVSRLVLGGGRASVEQGRRTTNQRSLMPDPVLDPSLAAEDSPRVSAELRNQLQAIAHRFAGTSAVNLLELTFSDPPTQAGVQAIADKLDELIIALNPA